MGKFLNYPETHIFMFERDVIILSNIVQFAKKNKTFNITELCEYCKNNIPFDVSEKKILFILEEENHYIEHNGDIYSYSC